MVCTTGSVQTAAAKTAGAMDQIEKLQTALKAQEAATKTTFYTNIDTHLASANITDARETGYDMDIKTEYSYEFSLDKIVAVVTTSIKAAIAATDPAVPEAPTSTAALEAYSDVVVAVAEAAKSTSDSAAALSFSMTRMSPGIYAFLYAESTNIKDVDTFGQEAVSTTAIYYRIIQSINDVQSQSKFDGAIILAKTLKTLKTVQAGLADSLASGDLTIEEYTKRDDALDKAIQKKQKELDDTKFGATKTLSLNAADGYGPPIDHSFAEGDKQDQALVKKAIEKMSSMGEAYDPVVKNLRERLDAVYY